MAKKIETTVGQTPAETTIGQTAARDPRVSELAEKLFIRLVTSRVGDGRTPEHYAKDSLEKAREFIKTLDSQ
jgi:hypothetical protein